MAGSALVPDQPFHVRSISMPSRPQPLALRIEEELHTLRTCVASSASSTTAEVMCNGLRGLRDLYGCIEELLCLPSNQQALSHPHQKKRVEWELDSSVKVLDLCITMRDNLVAIKEYAQDLCLAIRRKDASLESKLHAYIRSGKNAQKEIKNCFRSLKQMDNKCRSISTQDKDCCLLTVVRMLMEAREITISLLRAVLSSLSRLRPKSNGSGWSFVSKALHRRKVACEDELEYTSAVENLDGLETGLECLFRKLIQNRVSLLNIISF